LVDSRCGVGEANLRTFAGKIHRCVDAGQTIEGFLDSYRACGAGHTVELELYLA
jgi:hypothetical protein